MIRVLLWEEIDLGTSGLLKYKMMGRNFGFKHGMELLSMEDLILARDNLTHKQVCPDKNLPTKTKGVK